LTQAYSWYVEDKILMRNEEFGEKAIFQGSHVFDVYFQAAPGLGLSTFIWYHKIYNKFLTATPD